MKKLCIYHGNCADGFGAAWAVREALGRDVEFHAGVYQAPPPDVAARHVILVDFSYKRPIIEEMARTARSITILDHHKSAAEDLQLYTLPPENMLHAFDDFAALCEFHSWIPIRAHFDMEKSGAMIAWEYFHPGCRPPRLISHIQDRDLWHFELPGTRAIQACVFSYPYDFGIWDMLMASDPNQLRQDGEVIERKHFKDIEELTKVVTRRMVIGGHDVPVANLPYTLASDAGHALAQGEPFAGCYWDTPNGRCFSLRSTDDGLDVVDIAKQYGGGGHPHASGFTVPWGHELTQPESPT